MYFTNPIDSFQAIPKFAFRNFEFCAVAVDIKMQT